MKFEYRVVPVGAGRQTAPEQIEGQLNKLGDIGWELVGVLEREKTRPCLLLKKPTEED
jgi:hypothetical protein